MAAKGIFVRGFTADEVKAIQAKAKALLLEGKTIMSWNDGGGTSVTKQMVMPVSEILEECAYALRRLEPASASPNTGAHDAGRCVAFRCAGLRRAECSDCGLFAEVWSPRQKLLLTGQLLKVERCGISEAIDARAQRIMKCCLKYWNNQRKRLKK